MNEIDVGKLNRLRLDHVQARASLDGLTQAHRDSRDASQRMVMLFPLSRGGQNHYKVGDDPVEAFLTLSPEQQARVPAECRAAREIQAERQHARDLQARIEMLRPTVDALAQLLKASDAYVEGLQ